MPNTTPPVEVNNQWVDPEAGFYATEEPEKKGYDFLRPIGPMSKAYRAHANTLLWNRKEADPDKPGETRVVQEFIEQMPATLVYYADIRTEKYWDNGKNAFVHLCGASNAAQPDARYKEPFCTGTTAAEVASILTERGMEEARVNGIVRSVTENGVCRQCAYTDPEKPAYPILLCKHAMGKKKRKCNPMKLLWVYDWQREMVFKLELGGMNFAPKHTFNSPFRRFSEAVGRAKKADPTVGYSDYTFIMGGTCVPPNGAAVLNIQEPRLIDKEEERKMISDLHDQIAEQHLKFSAALPRDEESAGSDTLPPMGSEEENLNL